jgi:hypothetical protein
VYLDDIASCFEEVMEFEENIESAITNFDNDNYLYGLMSVKASLTDIRDMTTDCEGLASTAIALAEVIGTGNVFTISLKLTQNILFNGLDIYNQLHSMVYTWRWGNHL